MNTKFLITTVFLILICPFLSIPVLFYGVYHHRRHSMFLLAFVAGLFAFMLAPVGDLYRHTMMYYMFDGMSFATFSSTLDDDFIMQSAAYYMANSGIPYPFLRLVYVTLSYLMVFKMYKDTSQECAGAISKRQQFVKFLLVFSSVDLIGVASGVRWGVASMTFVYAFFQWNKHNRLYAICLFALSIATHYTLLYYLVVIVLMALVPLKNKKLLLFIALIALLLSEFLISKMVGYFEANDLEGSVYLGDGEWARGFNVAIMGMILYYFRKYLCFPVFYLQNVCCQKRDYFYRVTYVVFLVVLISLPLSNIVGRTGVMYRIMVAILLAGCSWQHIRPHIKCYRFVVACYLISFLSTFYSARAQLELSRMEDMFKPLPVILIGHDYSLNWLYQNVNSDGSSKRW